MTQESTAPAVVRLNNPAALLASLPALLGFVPRESVVVLAVHRRQDGTRLGAMLRADLPTDPEGTRAVVRALAGRLAATGPDAVQTVIVAEHDGRRFDDLPHVALVDALADRFTADRIEAYPATWAPRITGGAPWRCYEACCAGILPDPGATEVAAHLTVTGRVTYRSREDAAAAISPDPAAGTDRRRDQLDAAHRVARTARARIGNQAARDDLDAVRAAAASVGHGDPLDAGTVARVAAALADHAVRDVAMGFAAGCDDAVTPDHAEQLWWALTRATPAPEVAEPASLLAFAAIEHGGGALQHVALERATNADPDHTLSRLLAAVLDRGMDPASVRTLTTRAAAEAAATLAP